MLQNYFKVALRNIRKHKFYAALNILGLASGLTACFLIGLYIADELTFDRFHKDYQNIYHVGMHVNFGGQEFKAASSVAPLAQAMLQTIPGVEAATRLNPWPVKKVVMKYGDKAFKENNAFLADSNFFDFFSFKLLEGNVKTVLKEPYTMVLTTASANRYFGAESPMGKIITVGNKNEAYTVTGIAEEAPSNSHIQYDMLLSTRSDHSMQSGDWAGNDGTYTYIRKNPETSLSSVQSKLRSLVMQHVAPQLETFFGVSLEEFEKQGGIYSYFAFPLSRGHLYYHDEIPDGPYLASDIRYVYIMGGVGSFILLIACINFMNLSTARSASRAREVGMRKTLGSARSKLIVQFLSESFVYAFAATVIAIAGVYLLLPAFNLLSGKTLLFSALLSPVILVFIGISFVVVALLAGSYPAFYLTSFKPIDVLKGKVSAGMKSKGIRSSLVVVQFAMSILLMICTMVVYDQLGYLQEKNIGLDKQNVLVLQNANRLGTNQDAFFEAVNNQSGIVKASYTNNEFPLVNSIWSFRIAGTTRDLLIPCYAADYDHLDVLKIELLQGRYFSRAFASDSLAVVLNEAAVRELGLSDPLNAKLLIDVKASPMTVVGVVKDFNFESFKSKVKPLVIRLKARSDFMLIRYTPDRSAKEVVASLDVIWKKHAANEPFEYTFLDQDFDTLFREEQRLGKVVTVMSGIAIFVACLGLLGLAAFTAEQRTKEIGIRKVMGATVASINTLLSKEFMMLVGISFIIASAVAWYTMDSWLGTFAYRISLSPIAFLLSGLLAAGIALLTVSYHFIRVARSNPSEALKCE